MLELDIKLVKRQHNGAKQRAKRLGRPFTITVQDIIDLWQLQGGLCALSGLPMTQCTRDLYSFHIDQREPGAGYTRENVQLCCQAMNSLKMNASNEDAIRFINQLRRTNAS
jgi:hypothetical protein